MQKNRPFMNDSDDCRLCSLRDELGSWSPAFDISISLSALLTFVFNIFVVIILVTNYRTLNRRNEKKQSLKVKPEKLTISNTNLSFISLSISAILYSSICVPALYFRTMDDHENQSSWAVFILLKVLFYTSPIASSFVNLFLSFDRYLAIENLMSQRQFWHKRHYSFCLILLWIIGFLLTIPLVWYDNYTHQMQVIIRTTRLMVSFIVPSILSLVLYLRIAFLLVNWSREASAFESSLQQSRTVAIKILILAITHFICWVPFSVVESLNDLFPDQFYRCDTDLHKNIYYRTMAMLILLTSLSGVAYPILYCFISKQFQKILRKQFSSVFGSKSAGRYRATNLKHSISDSTNTTEILSIIYRV